MNLRPTHLALIVTDHSCQCGNKWTGSNPVLTDRDFNFWGGTPIAEDLLLPAACIVPEKKKHQICFRCCQAPLHIRSTIRRNLPTISRLPLTSNPESLDDL